MNDFFKDEEANKVLHDYVYSKFVRNSGLMRHEFFLHFNPNLEYNGSEVDYVISAGKVVHIALRCFPTEQRFAQLCRHIFAQSLRPFLRVSLSLVPKKDADRWVSLAVSKPEINPAEGRISEIRYDQEVIVSIKLTDKKTKKVVIVDVGNSDMFSVKEKALFLLYGEKLS